MEAPSQPIRKTTTVIEHDDITLEFTKDRGEQRLKIVQETVLNAALSRTTTDTVVLPLWAILEIRDYCARHLPSYGPPEHSPYHA